MGPEPVRPKGLGKGSESQPKERPAVGRADPFGLWLRRSLQDAFGDVTAEPVPAEMLRIIEEASGGQDRNE